MSICLCNRKARTVPLLGPAVPLPWRARAIIDKACLDHQRCRCRAHGPRCAGWSLGYIGALLSAFGKQGAHASQLPLKVSQTQKEPHQSP